MSRAVPIVPTIIVALAALLMVRLGFWQIHRLHEKEALLALYSANAAKPALPFAALFPIGDAALYRRASAHCLNVVGWKAEAGRSASGAPGWRHVAACRTGIEGPGFMVDMGVSPSSATPAWTGGDVRGRITWAPGGVSWLARLFTTPQARSPMIVSETAAPGLVPTAQPNPSDIPNNHLSYAVQWFIFAGLALTIYALALWQRRRKASSGNSPERRKP
ncbi:MAG TPA: SURF1 family protein [Sphingomonas sp.]|nr:SURF1 family protein [Sphingomonas sp.]